MKKNLIDIFNKYNLQELISFKSIIDEFLLSGVTPETSIIRIWTIQCFDDNTILTLSIVCHEYYIYLCNKLLKQHEYIP